MRRLSVLRPHRQSLSRSISAIALLVAIATAHADAQQPQYEIAVSRVAIEPAAPAAGQGTALTVFVRIRPLTPVSRPWFLNLRVLFMRAQQGEALAAAETYLGEQIGTMRLGDVARVSVPWLAESGNHVLLAHVEVLPGQRIDARDVLVASEQPTTLTVPDAEPASQSAVEVVRPQGAADPNRTIREPSPGESQSGGDRRITTTALGIVGGQDPASGTARGIMIDVPVYVVNASEVRAVEVRCSVFAQPLGDLIGTGQVIRRRFSWRL